MKRTLHALVMVWLLTTGTLLCADDAAPPANPKGVCVIFCKYAERSLCRRLVARNAF